ncbi:hypothetical protein AYO38_01220 [bacterium SCGC AG-212-C10]|nr:hypothetical protein AYO38_01220 [bacterium SCGC AG-212-C10]
MRTDTGAGPAWGQKSAEGKMFVRRECDSCGRTFHFSDSPRITRVPTCPTCGSFTSHVAAA